jgi:hypothetical protein
MSAEERQRDLITELDVLFGEDQPWYGFTRLEPPITPEKEGRTEEVSLTYRRGVKSMPFSLNTSSRILILIHSATQGTPPSLFSRRKI